MNIPRPNRFLDYNQQNGDCVYHYIRFNYDSDHYSIDDFRFEDYTEIDDSRKKDN